MYADSSSTCTPNKNSTSNEKCLFNISLKKYFLVAKYILKPILS